MVWLVGLFARSKDIHDGLARSLAGLSALAGLTALAAKVCIMFQLATVAGLCSLADLIVLAAKIYRM